MEQQNEQLILLPWKNLYRMFKGVRYSSGENHRSFRAWTGCSPFVCEKIFRKYQNRNYLPNRSRLIIALNYMKVMPTEDEGASSFKTRKTYRKYVWDALFYLEYFMNEINIDYRFLDPVASSGVFSDITLIVDGTDCPINRPGTRELRNTYTNGRNKENISSRYNLKYTIACQISTGRICWVGGPDPGSMTDIEAIKNSSLLVYTFSDSDDILLADKGYQGQPRMLTPFKGPSILAEEAAFNDIIASVRILVECVIKRIKHFGALGSRGRFHSYDHDKHFSLFRVACQITNICLEEEPIWSHSSFYLQ